LFGSGKRLEAASTVADAWLGSHEKKGGAEDGFSSARSFVDSREMTMGINARCGDVKTELIERVTRSREDLERELEIRSAKVACRSWTI
jgi:hypothetical protein